MTPVVEQRTDATGAGPEREAKSKSSPEEDRDCTVTACIRNDAIQDCAHDAGKTFVERDQVVVRTVNGTARACSIECHQYEIREIIFPASIKQAMQMQAQAQAEHRKREECLQK